MGTYSISMTFIVDAKDDEAANELSERIGNCVVHEDELATEFSIIDVEQVEADLDDYVEDDE